MANPAETHPFELSSQAGVVAVTFLRQRSAGAFILRRDVPVGRRHVSGSSSAVRGAGLLVSRILGANVQVASCCRTTLAALTRAALAASRENGPELGVVDP